MYKKLTTKRLYCLTVLSFLFMGCAPFANHLQQQLDAGEYSDAVNQVLDDPKLQLELAAMIVERTALNNSKQAPALLGRLAAGGASGKRALKRISANDDIPGRLATLMLHRSKTPEQSELESFFNDESSEVRTEAARMWCSKLDTKRLLKLTDDQDPRVRLAAVSALEERVDGDAAELKATLVRMLDSDPSAKVRATVAARGPLLGENPLLVLKKALKDQSLGVRLAAIKGLAQLGDEAALEIVGELAMKPMDTTTVVAAAELARLGKEAGIERLKEALKDKRPSIRSTAMLRLERADIKERSELVAKMLKDTEPSVVMLAAGLLEKDENFREKLMEALEDIVEENQDRFQEARDMLAVFGQKKARQQVTAILEKGKKESLLTISRVQSASVFIPLFVNLMGSEFEETRLAAAKALLSNQR